MSKNRLVILWFCSHMTHHWITKKGLWYEWSKSVILIDDSELFSYDGDWVLVKAVMVSGELVPFETLCDKMNGFKNLIWVLIRSIRPSLKGKKVKIARQRQLSKTTIVEQENIFTQTCIRANFHHPKIFPQCHLLRHQKTRPVPAWSSSTPGYTPVPVRCISIRAELINMTFWMGCPANWA